MNYDSIAKIVHKCVKNPNSILAKGNGSAECGDKTKELSIIQTVFSKYEVSGDVILIGALPNSGGWW
jgi:hypothetical protein